MSHSTRVSSLQNHRNLNTSQCLNQGQSCFSRRCCNALSSTVACRHSLRHEWSLLHASLVPPHGDTSSRIDPYICLQAHRSGMVSAIGANSGIITCGIFGSVMWWPEAELRSCIEAAGMILPGESNPGGTANLNMSRLLQRYFTPSSAALAQATLQHMHSRGALQVSPT